MAPFAWAEEWDNVGLQIGNAESSVDAILVTLNVDFASINEARKRGANLIVAHHPVIFRPLRRLQYDRPIGKVIRELVSHRMNVIVAHTNLDFAPQGVNYQLGQLLGLQGMQVLDVRGRDEYYKLVVFVPRGYEDVVREAMGKVGAGWIGNYSFCTFQSAGTGTFMPLEGSNPFQGEIGQLEKADELRLETIVPKRKSQTVVEAMLKAHPYEEVAYDLYPLANEGMPWGLGMIGNLPEPISLSDLVDQVKERYLVPTVRVVGDLDLRVKRVAVCGGSGGTVVDSAVAKGADVLITGDIKYHEALDADAQGLAVIDAGHQATEEPVVPAVADYLRRYFRDINMDVPVFTFVGHTNADPVRTV